MAARFFADRVAEYGTCTGTGDVTLTGSCPIGFQRFNTATGNTDKSLYIMIDDLAGNWEITKSEYDASQDLAAAVSLTRATAPESSSNSGAKISFGSGSHLISLVVPASEAGSNAVWTDTATGTKYRIVFVNGSINKQEVAA